MNPRISVNKIHHYYTTICIKQRNIGVLRSTGTHSVTNSRKIFGFLYICHITTNYYSFLRTKFQVRAQSDTAEIKSLKKCSTPALFLSDLFCYIYHHVQLYSFLTNFKVKQALV